MADAAHEQIDVAASPARCFAVATAFEAYPEWTSDVKRATVLERDALGRGTRVEYQVAGLGRRVRYVLDYDFTEAPHAFSWSLVEGDMLRALDGRYAFAPTGASPNDASPHQVGTHVDYTLAVDLAVPMPGLVKRRASGMIMGNALRDLKRVLEHTEEHTEEVVVEEDMVTDETTPDSTPEPEPVIGRTPHPDAVPFDEAGTESRPLPPPSILESVLTELLGAVPEVKDHVLEAADALLDAAKALIDAADRVICQQRGEE
jgi:Polyketide cyclase / dehydrase and lipid transport